MNKKIKFSVVMPIYNREKYLQEAIDSIVKQTYGFKNIELILVDDGSTDGSGKICDDYQKRFPNNCKVIHQENQGAAAARRAGVNLVTGEWINFLDSDDKLEKNAVDAVAKFIKKYKNQTDVIAIPILFFGAKKGNHILNYKFQEGDRIIDLEKDWDKPQLSLSSTFVNANTAKKVAFKGTDNLLVAEDAIELIHILLEKRTLGVLSKTKYWYRKHKESLLGNAVNHAKFYTYSLQNFSLNVLKYAEEKMGKAPKFVQFIVMYDLQWKIRQKRIPPIIQPYIDIDEYRRLLLAVCNQIDVDVILKQRNIWREQKYYLLANRNCNLDGIDYLGFQEIPLKILFMDIHENKLYLEGWYPKYLYDRRGKVELYIDVDGEKCKCDLHSVSGSSDFLGEKLFEQNFYRIELFLNDKRKHIISFFLKNSDKYYLLYHITTSNHVPLDSNSNLSYKTYKNWILQKQDNFLILQKKRNILLKEVLYITDILKKHSRGSLKAISVRIMYGILTIFPHKKIWLISDRIMKANDNGESFFRFMASIKLTDIKFYFVINKKSPDFKRLKKIGPVVSSFSIKHRLLYLLSEYNISSQADKIIQFPFHGYEKAYRSLNIPKFIFLQHGVTKDDLSSWLKRSNKNIFGFVTATKLEYNSILEQNYGYSERQVWLTGFCRFDYLEDHSQKMVSIAPTWRNYLVNAPNSYTGLRNIAEEFTQSEYYIFYNQLINDEKLLTCLEKKGYRLKFIPHPVMIPYIKLFNCHPKVEFANEMDSYTELFAESSLFITDYSSTAFDFAYLKKPVIYCQFDYEMFFGGNHTYQKGYFDYERDGFGEVEYTLEDTVNRIIEYVENDCKLKPEYEKRIDNTFAFRDRNNCKRVYDKLIEMRDK